MESTILNTPRIYNGAGVYNTGANGGGGVLDLTKFFLSTGEELRKLQNFSSAGNLVWRCMQQSTGWFWTQQIDLTTATIIEEEWNFTVEQFEAYEYGSIGPGEWYTNNQSSTKCQFSIYIYSDRILITYGNAQSETFNINYSIGTKVKVKKYIDQLTANIKVYYNDSLVVDFSTARNNLIFGNYRFHVGGLRFIPVGVFYGLYGTMDFKKCYIKIDNNLVWGVDS